MRVLFGVLYCSLTGGTHHPLRLALELARAAMNVVLACMEVLAVFL